MRVMQPLMQKGLRACSHGGSTRLRAVCLANAGSCTAMSLSNLSRLSASVCDSWRQDTSCYINSPDFTARGVASHATCAALCSKNAKQRPGCCWYASSGLLQGQCRYKAGTTVRQQTGMTAGISSRLCSSFRRPKQQRPSPADDRAAAFATLTNGTPRRNDTVVLTQVNCNFTELLLDHWLPSLRRLGMDNLVVAR